MIIFNQRSRYPTCTTWLVLFENVIIPKVYVVNASENSNSPPYILQDTFFFNKYWYENWCCGNVVDKYWRTRVRCTCDGCKCSYGRLDAKLWLSRGSLVDYVKYYFAYSWNTNILLFLYPIFGNQNFILKTWGVVSMVWPPLLVISGEKLVHRISKEQRSKCVRYLCARYDAGRFFDWLCIYLYF